MNSNKIIIIVSILACLVLISCPTVYKVIKKNHNSLIAVSEKKIIEAAEKCYYEDKCKESKVLLKDLYEKGYLKKKAVNPVTKEIYKDDAYVTIDNKKSKFFTT